MKGNNMTKAKLVTTSALTQIEPVLKDAIIAKVKSGVSLIQTLRDLGKSYTDLISPNGPNKASSTCTPEYFQSLKDTVVLGWTAERQALFNTPTKDLEPVDKLVKKTLQQDQNSVISDMKDQLEKEQNPDYKKGRSEDRSPLELFMSDLDKAQKRLGDNEEMFTHHDQVVIAMEELFNTIERSA